MKKIVSAVMACACLIGTLLAFSEQKYVIAAGGFILTCCFVVLFTDKKLLEN